MGALAHLVTAQQARGALGRNSVTQTEGTSWRWEYAELLDADGDPIPQATLATLTATCRIYDSGGNVIAEPTYAATADGEFTLSLDESVTVGLAGDAPNGGRNCRWGLTLSDGTDVIQVWTPSTSPFRILHAEI